MPRRALLLWLLAGLAYVHGEAADPNHIFWRISYPAVPFPDSLHGCTAHLTARGKQLQVWFGIEMPGSDRLGAEHMVPRFRIHHADGIADPWVATTWKGHGNDDVEGYSIWEDSPYGPNSFANGWIEAEILNETWWFEIPHGFLRDPSAPTCAPEPQTVQLEALPWMTSMKPHHLVPWRTVTLEQRQLKDGTKVLVRIAGPRNGSLVRVGLESAWDGKQRTTKFALHDRLSAATVAIPGYPLITGNPLSTLLTPDGNWRTETFACASVSHGMDFAAVSLAIDGEHLDWSVPCGVLVGSDHFVKWPVDPEAGKETEFVADEPGVGAEW